MVDGRHPATPAWAITSPTGCDPRPPWWTAATKPTTCWPGPREIVAILGRHGGRPPPGGGHVRHDGEALRSSAAMVDGRHRSVGTADPPGDMLRSSAAMVDGRHRAEPPLTAARHR